MICDVRVAEWETLPNGYRFRIHADRFLRNMVRAIVGTCIRIGKGQAQPESMLTVIAAKDRSMAGKSASARGLYSGARSLSVHSLQYRGMSAASTAIPVKEKVTKEVQGKAFDRELFGRVFAFTKPYRRVFRVTVLLTVILSIVGVVRPILAGLVGGCGCIQLRSTIRSHRWCQLECPQHRLDGRSGSRSSRCWNMDIGSGRSPSPS